MTADVWNQLSRYRQVKVLPGGLRVLLRPLGKDDADQLVELFARASPEDLERLRSDPTDRQVVERWVRDLDLSKIFPLMAIVNDRIIGDATLYFGTKFQRHLGWMRIFLDREYRRRGLGTLMIRALMDIGRQVGLHQVHALVPTDQPQVIKSFEHLGFKNEYVLRDYAILQDGRTLDVAELVLYLVEHTGEY
jgi:RimJ/RimL family protein N-acetyltransferase